MNSYDTQQALRAIWGAREMPFRESVKSPFEYSQFLDCANKLERYIGMKTAGMLTGPNGAGKTVLLNHVLGNLSEKHFSISQLSHTTLTGSDMIRRLCHLNGLPSSLRRSDNIQQLLEAWIQDGRTPVLAIDEAQYLNPATLEELRLLNCERTCSAQGRQSGHFAMILCGDEDLMPMINLNVHRALRSRMSFHLRMNSFSQDMTEQYILFQWQNVGVQHSPFDGQALNLIHAAADGCPRTINNIAGNAILIAIDDKDKSISVEHIQRAIDQIPWIGMPQ